MDGLAGLYAAVGFGWAPLAEAAPLLARVGVGLMFFLSGAYKLFSASQAEKMGKTMVEAGVAAPRQTARFVSVCEFVFGALLAVGLFTALAAVVLIVISVVALLTVTGKQVEGASFGYRLSSYLDLPETLLILLLLIVLAIGPGPVSLDALLFGGNRG